MKYTMLLWPHANARYQQETRKLAAAELKLMLGRTCPEAAVEIDEASSMPCLDINCPGALDEPSLHAIARHSLLYQLFERREDKSLLPVLGRAPALLGDDLPAILKYKGKTNEMFLQLLINVGLYAGDFWDSPEGLSFLDPMCGRATAPFIALNRGWNATGADVDKNDLKEAERFFKRYLEYHRFKHHMTREARTLRGGKSAPVVKFEATPPEQSVTLNLMNCDAARTAEAMGRSSVHLIACDLPYGVRHDAMPGQSVPRGGNWLEALLVHALPAWHSILKPGGTVALSFNAQSFRRDRLRHLMADAGFEVMNGGEYDHFEHWVEQAITRDVAVARKAR